MNMQIESHSDAHFCIFLLRSPTETGVMESELHYVRQRVQWLGPPLPNKALRTHRTTEADDNEQRAGLVVVGRGMSFSHRLMLYTLPARGNSYLVRHLADGPKLTF